MGKPFTIDGEIVLVGVSIGISVASVGDGPTAESLLKEADLALYEAKSAGRGTHRFFEPHIGPQNEHCTAPPIATPESDEAIGDDIPLDEVFATAFVALASSAPRGGNLKVNRDP